MTQAIVIFAHGSKDALWRQPVEAVATSVQSSSPNSLVRCAYLELTPPTLMTALTELTELGATSVRILPLFLGIGKHLREDLPVLVTDLKEQFPQIHVEVLPSVGENAQVIQLLARIALGVH
jgi:sirohydrochlorin cobaltochelatase